MAFLAKHRKEELMSLAEDMGIEFSPTDKKIHIYKKIKESPDFEEEFVRGCLEDIVKQREAEAAELKTQREAEALRQEREFELKKIRLSNAVVTRGQKLKKETEASAVIKPPPQRPVQEENPYHRRRRIGPTAPGRRGHFEFIEGQFRNVRVRTK
ncbi:hypothetical protein AVEN_55465-1 [Araneus ventricosus]|uniref:Uncharacterized protein n=1 Tax=Araneus ventricosus TaxID=182803 RepID=A0A4Y2TSL5_ARAVE|nr:hypothetical protein AVEN_55465-1 [Araneus ventricosus]